jgi:tetratricopeptide (TPR) repeat protein/tRNA A-37 threonylcarbamoyl transferase component Bud32
MSEPTPPDIVPDQDAGQTPPHGPQSVNALLDDQTRRWRQGERPRLEDYLGAQSALLSDREDFLDLVYNEVGLREERGETPQLAEYQARFPDYASQLHDQFQVRQALQGSAWLSGMAALETAAQGPGPLADQPPPAPPPMTSDQPTDAVGTHGSPRSAGLRYRPLRFHARGGLGEVHVAQDIELGRPVAFKRIRPDVADEPEYRRRFLREAEITARLEHPGVVPVHGLVHDSSGQPWYAMRFIEGPSLLDAIAQFHEQDARPGRDPGERTLALRQLLSRFVAVCNTVAYAHSRGIVHRDLKPANVMLGKYGETLVVDWGLAKPVERSAADRAGGEETVRPTGAQGSPDTAAGALIGTPGYMSPEQAMGRSEAVGPASDIYSLGATLYCLLTGRPPFAEGLMDRLANQDDFPRPRQVKRDIPPALEAICLKAMQAKARDRYATALALAQDIEHWLADEPVAAWPDPVRVKARRWMRRHKPLVSGVAAALVVILIGLSASLMWYRDQEAQTAQRAVETARAIAQHLAQCRQKRQELHTALSDHGGVQKLLNQAARWQALIQAARSHWQTAWDLAGRAEQPVPRDLTDLLQHLDQELTRDEADHRLALRLEKIRLDQAVLVEGKLNKARAPGEYRRTFEKAGLSMGPGREKTVAARIRQSAIKEQLVAALDNWAWAVFQGQDKDLSARLLATARLADPDPWRDQVRNLARWQQPQVIRQLAEDALRHSKRMARLSPQALVVVHLLLPSGEREKWLRQAQALHPDDFWINYELAEVLFEKKNLLEACGFYRVTLALRPDTPVVYNNFGNALHDQKDLPGAIAAYHKAVAIDPRFAQAWNNLGNSLYGQGDLPRAVAAYRKALAINPQYARAWSNLGNTLRDQKDLPGAVAALKKALAIDPQFALAWNNFGLALHDQKDLPAAIAAYHKALTIDPKYAPAWYNLGNTLRDQKDLPGAVAAYQEALAIDPQYARAWNNLGLALYARKDLPEAIAAYRNALAIRPQHARAWNNLGVALHDQKDLPGAIAAYRKALAINPQYARAWNNLGNTLRDQKDLPGAIAAFQTGIKVDPRDVQGHTRLAIALWDQGEFKDAAAALQRALHLLPSGHPWRSGYQQDLKRCQQLLALEQQLPRARNGEKLSPAEYLALADLCVHYKKRYLDAVALYTKGFAGRPKLAHDPKTGLRYNAACAAALAAAGKGVGAGNLSDQEKSRLRQEGLTWLKADLAARRMLLEQNPREAAAVKQALGHWQQDPHLAGLREAAALANLPEAEARACHRLWAEVQTLLQRAESK